MASIYCACFAAASIYCACFAAEEEWRASTAPASQPQHLPAILPPACDPSQLRSHHSVQTHRFDKP
ncbi:hypothetical protein PF005_g13712 [Phytophthora fragariae]|uniref:RxLR effector protein n=1 Tax=Phytophthora fragariae TaxID=53985 RepID=A0A6A3EQM9_9STRA|nr:hypothetical protein PF003_g9519 [Phytophthora fragariae]KAE8934231.1 hypothetical protein PF009_g15782 [Phytophthora fragariae]KAE9000376.1 hypothetical protein PF011_g14207 [Phytophthora fragariae]KAE9103572.1 hypothetical protein PF007_g14361 [Phytophthora fragariae]KAE9141026.1 hypothetical protein PF006_g13390 [Phytophthora fragariae]